MQVEFLKAFYKDLDKLQNKKVAFQLRNFIELTKKASSPDQIGPMKKLQGHPSAYRIRILNYRAGVFLEGDTIVFARLLPRKDIYKYFPK